MNMIPHRWHFAMHSLLVCLMIGSSVALAAPPAGKGGGKDKGGEDGGGDPVDSLPSIRYRLTISELPIPRSTHYSGLNEVGQLVGYFVDANGNRGLYMFDVISLELTRLDLLVDQSQLPAGWTIGGALDINDHGVVVGFVIDDGGDYQACAIDLSVESPVIDLLPRSVGSGSAAIKINNAGDILATELVPSALSDYEAYEVLWTCNPGYYGPVDSRQSREAGFVLDLRAAAVESVPTLVTSGHETCDLSEPLFGGPAQVAGIDLDRVPFRYTIGASSVERYLEVTQEKRPSYFAGISASGTVAGQATIVVGTKGKNTVTEQVNYRLNADLDTTYLALESLGVPEDINNFDEILLRGNINRSVFRDWGDGLGERAVNLYDLVVGDSEDVARFDENVVLYHMNDAGIIAGFIYSNTTEIVVVLTPEPVAP